MKDIDAQIRATIERAQLTAGWPQSVIDELCANAEFRLFADGERAIIGGRPAESVAIVVEGSFLLSRSWQNGRRFLYSFLKPGQSAGVHAVFDRKPPTFDVTARGSGAVVFISGETLRVAAARHPEIAMKVIADLCRSARADHEAIELHAMNSVRCRIAKAILWIAQGQTTPINGEIVVDSRISQEDLADIVCAARQSVNRELRRMMKEGILKQRYRTLVILDRARLIRVAEDEETITPVTSERMKSAPQQHHPAAE